MQIITLILVMLGIFGLTWLTTRFMAKRLPGGGRSGHLQIIEKLQVGRDRQIALIKAGNKHYMVGIAGQQISFSQPVEIDSPTYSEIQDKVNHDQEELAKTENG